jgi:hypothetical protein
VEGYVNIWTTMNVGYSNVSSVSAIGLLCFHSLSVTQDELEIT